MICKSCVFYLSIGITGTHNFSHIDWVFLKLQTLCFVFQCGWKSHLHLCDVQKTKTIIGRYFVCKHQEPTSNASCTDQGNNRDSLILCLNATNQWVEGVKDVYNVPCHKFASSDTDSVYKQQTVVPLCCTV